VAGSSPAASTNTEAAHSDVSRFSFAPHFCPLRRSLSSLSYGLCEALNTVTLPAQGHLSYHQGSLPDGR